MIRVVNYGLRISRNYAKAIGIDYKDVIIKINKLFQTQPKFTGKGEPIYCSGILNILFSKIIEPKIK
mgnify:FL=1